MSELSADQHKAIELLLVTPTLGAVARKVKVDPRTLYRWMRDPDFAAELRTAQRQVIRQNLRGIANMGATAIKTLTELMGAKKDPRLRFEAAQHALERLFDADIAMRADEGGNPEAVPAVRDGPW